MTLACEDAYSKLVEVVTVADVSDEDRVGISLFQIGKLRFGHKAKLLFNSQLPNLQQTVANTILSINISNTVLLTSTRLELASSHARVTSIKFTKQESVSE